MKRGIKYIILISSVVFILLLTAIIVLAESGNEPIFKLQENIRQMFRPDWVWDEKINDYTNMGKLKRDSETGLFPEPSPFPEDLVGKAYWDPYLGLYIRDTINIDHKTGEITEDQLVMTSSHKDDWPVYVLNSNDEFDKKYKEYSNLIKEKYYKGGLSSIAIPDIEIFKKEGFTPEWFGLTIEDLPILVEKLESGAPQSYTMSLIMLITKTDVGMSPSFGEQYRYCEWVDAFNSLKAQGADKIKHGDLAGLGYLALPYIYDELNSGNDTVLKLLSEAADGLNGYTKATALSWDKSQWLNWFKENKGAIDALRLVNEHEIYMPWLD